MKTILTAALLCAVLMGLVTSLALGQLQGDTYEPDAYGRFVALQGVVSWCKWLVGIALLVAAARLGAQLPNRNLALGLMLLPLLLFVVLGFLDWVVLGDASARYLQRHGRWNGTESGAPFFMLTAYPLAAAATLAASLWMLGRR